MIVATSPLNRPRGTRVVVPTMGSLHEGHRALMRAARKLAGSDGEVVVTIFVNPTQFAADEDFDRYPRNMEHDLEACSTEGVDVVYTPSVETVYGTADPAQRITVSPGPLGQILEGEHRPGHFAGVLTVVSILLHHVAPSIGVFGEKDYQQLVLIRRMCADLSYGVEIVGVPTVRDVDGLALSSRNAYLAPDDRSRATVIWRALEAGASAGPQGAQAVVAAAQAELQKAAPSNQTVDYVQVCGTDLGPAPESGVGRLLIAATVGGTRLIDNTEVRLGGTSDV